MSNSLATLTLVLLIAGTAAAQQPRRSAGKKSSTSTSSTISPNDMARSNPSAANTYDGTNGASTGTGLTNDQQQASKNQTNGPAKVDANSSVRTGASSVKGRKKKPKSVN